MKEIVLMLACFAVASGEEVLKKPEITFLHINSDVKFRFATTTVESRMKNPSEHSREVIFDVTLPNEAFITNLTLEINGETIQGEIKEKNVAKKQYDTAKAMGQSAGYIGTKHRETNKFDLAVTVAAREKVQFLLTYQELLTRKHGHYEQVIYIDPGETVEDLQVNVNILESRKITKLNVPRLRNDIEIDEGQDISDVTEISQHSPNQATVKFNPSVEEQQKKSESGMAGQFVVQYDVERHDDSGEILLVNGYFVHYFAPSGYTRLPTDVLFILDVSGSMFGRKMSQMQAAMRSILHQLSEEDRFNILTFSTGMNFWKTEMVNIADEDMMEEALDHVDKLQAQGWTNIEGALRKGLEFLAGSEKTDDVRSTVVVFLTDGEATKGITNRDQIMESVIQYNEGKVPIFSLAFGKGADYELVKKLSVQNNGFGRKIYEASDAAMQIAGFYNEISATLMSNVTFHYLDAPVKNVTKNVYPNYFNGSEMVVCGRFMDFQLGPDKMFEGILKMVITGDTTTGQREIVPAVDSIITKIELENATTGDDEFEKITEKVWAYLTIKQLLDKRLASLDSEEKEDIKKKVINMSIKYGFVTPMTSMVVTLPEVEDALEGRVATEDVFDEVADADLPGLAGLPGLSGVYHSPPSMSAPSGRMAYAQHHGIAPMGGRVRDPSLNQMPVYYNYLSADDDAMKAKRRKGSQNGGLIRPNIAPTSTPRVPIVYPTNTTAVTSPQKRKEFTYPLMYGISKGNNPLCLTFKTATPGDYLLYADESNELSIVVSLDVQSYKKKDIVTVSSVNIIYRNITYPITKSSADIKAATSVDNAPWTIKAKKDNTRIKVSKKFSFIILHGDNSMSIYIGKLKKRVGTSSTGIIGHLASQKMRIKANDTDQIGQIQVSRKAKRPSHGPIIRRKSGQIMKGLDKCWVANRKEEKLVDIALYKL